MGETLLAVEAHGLQTAIAQHLGDLRVLLTIFTENKLALVVVVLVLSTSPVLTTLERQLSAQSLCIWMVV